MGGELNYRAFELLPVVTLEKYVIVLLVLFQAIE